MYLSEILILDGPANYPPFHDKKQSDTMKKCNHDDVINMYGKKSEKCCFLKKNGNKFITI